MICPQSSDLSHPNAHCRWFSILDAPDWYWQLNDDEHSLLCNGCGAANAKFDFVPDTIWGLCITPACHVHDAMYSQGKNIEDKASADRTFMNNLLRLIERELGWLGKLLKPFRRRRALKYYEAVVAFGGPAFWSNKT